MSARYEVVVVGMGPGGLSAATKLSDAGLSFAIIDAGKAVNNRDRYLPEDATRGQGGAGLFSDGKFSFYPSASELWSLNRSQDIRRAYDWTTEVLTAAGLDCPPFPENPNAYQVDAGTQEWIMKSYPCDYIDLETRMKLVNEMVSCIQGCVYTDSHVQEITYNSLDDEFRLRLATDRSKKLTDISAKRVIISTGRFGPLEDSLKKLTTHYVFRRLEIGFRVQQNADKAFFRNMKQLDPKLRIKESDDSIEWRTFCVCRQGEVCLTKTNGLWTCSGRSDCPKTGLSNCGFNTRIFDEEVATTTWEKLLASLRNKDSAFILSAQALLSDDIAVCEQLDDVYGLELRLKMKQGLARLTAAFDDFKEDADAKLIGPTLEGVGWYPRVDGDLRLLDAPAWIAGDACGLFRGIVAAMISGHYAASSVINDLESCTCSRPRLSRARNNILKNPYLILE
ncbi:hypothetical protein MMC10_000875 [Thelotrema lepadinum]|nr:hypothetical protein [Thelotrema lepadinum]